MSSTNNPGPHTENHTNTHAPDVPNYLIEPLRPNPARALTEKGLRRAQGAVTLQTK